MAKTLMPRNRGVKSFIVDGRFSHRTVETAQTKHKRVQRKQKGKVLSKALSEHQSPSTLHTL